MARFRISSIMLVIALFALDIGLARAVMETENPDLFMISLIGLPMTNILAIGMLLATSRPRSRFFRGFEGFGALALALFVLAIFCDAGLVGLYLSPAIALDQAAFGPPPRLGQWMSYRFVAGVGLLSFWATLPQVSFALLGGLLARKSLPD